MNEATTIQFDGLDVHKDAIAIAVARHDGLSAASLGASLNEVGIACKVIAPSLIPVQPGARVKTDRRDARKFAQYLRSGDLTPIYWVRGKAAIQ